MLGNPPAKRPTAASGVRRLDRREIFGAPKSSDVARIFDLWQLMAGRQSAGVLLYRRRKGGCQVFVVHPGGPYWKSKDLGAWSIPKGECELGEEPLSVAKREFTEETGFEVSGTFVPLTPVKQPGGKWVHAWAVEGDCDPAAIKSNTFSMEWPPRSGKRREFPEVDRAGWFGLEEAAERINRGQRALLEELREDSRVMHAQPETEDRGRL